MTRVRTTRACTPPYPTSLLSSHLKIKDSTTSFSCVAAPHRPPSRVALRSSTQLWHGVAARPTLPRSQRHPCGPYIPRRGPLRRAAIPHVAPPSLATHVVLRPLSRLGQVARRGSRRWPGLGQAQAQLAAARLRHHPRPPAGRSRPSHRSALRRTEEG